MGHKPERRVPARPATPLALNDFRIENRKLKASIRALLDCYWGKGDGEYPPEFIVKAAALSGYKLKDLDKPKSY